MRKKLIYIQVSLLSVTLLLTGNSYAVTSHFCGTQLVAVSYTGKLMSCGMETTEKGCNKKSIKKDCCKDTFKIIDLNDFNKSDTSSFSFKTSFFIVSFHYAYWQIIIKRNLEKNFYKDFSPPDLTKDYQVLYDTFLI